MQDSKLVWSAVASAVGMLQTSTSLLSHDSILVHNLTLTTTQAPTRTRPTHQVSVTQHVAQSKVALLVSVFGVAGERKVYILAAPTFSSVLGSHVHGSFGIAVQCAHLETDKTGAERRVLKLALTIGS